MSEECRKRCYSSRKRAKVVRRRHHSETGLRPYFCPSCGCWHLGHLSPNILHGIADRSVFEPPAETA